MENFVLEYKSIVTQKQIHNNLLYPTKPILKVGITLLLHRCETYLNNKMITGQEKEKLLEDAGIKLKSYQSYVKKFDASWQLEQFVTHENEGPGQSVFDGAFNLAQQLDLMPTLDDHEVSLNQARSGPLTLEEKINQVSKFAFLFLENNKGNPAVSDAGFFFDQDPYPDLRSDAHSDNEQKKRALVLGTHDDVSFLEGEIKNFLEQTMNLTFEAIDYDALLASYENESKLEATNATFEDQESISLWDEEIYQAIESHIENKHYDIYFIIIGRSYGRPLKFAQLEKYGHSRRHFELLLAALKCRNTKNTPIYIYRPQASETLWKTLETKRKQLFINRGYSDHQSLGQALKEDSINLDTLEPVILNVSDLELGDCFEVANEDTLKEKIESSVVANFKTHKLLESQLVTTLTQRRGDHAKGVDENTWAQPLTDKAKEIYTSFEKHAKAKELAGFCLLLRGQNKKVINRALRAIEQENIWDVEKPVKQDLSDTGAQENIFWARLCRGLSINFNSVASRSRTIETISEILVTRRQPYMIILSNAGGLGMAPDEFLEKIWKPLYDSIEKHLKSIQRKHRWSPIHLLVSWKLNKLDDALCVNKSASPVSYSNFIDLPLQQTKQ